MLKLDNSKEYNNRFKEYYKLNYHVLESMADWVRVIDVHGKVIYANKVMKKALGDNIIGTKCNVHCIQETPCCFCIVERSIYADEVIQKEEILDGKYYSVKSSPVKDNDGNIIAAVEVFRDVSRERKLEQKLRTKNEKMSQDLDTAKRIQEKILPEPGKLGNLKLDFLYRPSEMLSGDMFDIFHIDSDNIGIYISDVSGHGVTASMMTMFIRQSMRFIKDEILSPSIALSELHRRFCTLQLDIDKYFTIFYGVFNKSTYEFKYANAGHNSIPLRINDAGIEALEISGYPISLLFDNIRYTEKKVKLDINDKILLYTDGVTEVKDLEGSEFGIDNLINILKENDENILSKIEKKIFDYGKGIQEDDFALMLLEVLK